MPARDEEDELLRSVALQNARSILLARQRAEEALERQSEWLRIVLSSIGDGVICTDAAGRVTFFNGVAEALTGWSQADALGRPLPDVFHIVHERTRQPVENPAVRALHEGTIVGLANHTILIARDGTERAIDDSAAPMRDGSGATVGAVLVFRDVTERKRTEEALREADHRKDEFLALLAHELRNPLAPLRNGLQVMRLAAGDARAVADARGMMERQLGHMVRLIDDLLDVSRINRNKMELRRSRVLLADILSSAIETARPLIDEAGHTFDVSIPTEPVALDADLTRLAQVFSNLLTNSAKYTDAGGHIWFDAERRGANVFVSVRDNGIGIPAESLPNIFDMFSQVDRSIERATGGLGIGLALVKGLVEMHDGTVSVESAGAGKGSTFTVRLPVLERPPVPANPETSDGGPAANGPKRRILVVDDNRDSANSLARLLTLLGNEVHTAHDGVEAAEATDQIRPEIILMDVGMPRLNGYEATRRIRAQPWGRSIVIIALTGWGQDGDRVLSSEAGCNGHLVKPVNLADLEKLLTEPTGSTIGESRRY
jgi:PAS domain S-box-containing protein